MERTVTEQSGRVETVEGVFIPDGWNSDFMVTSVFVACDGEREIVVRNLAERPEVLVMLRRRVRVTGLVFRTGWREAMDVERVVLLTEARKGHASVRSEE